MRIVLTAGGTGGHIFPAKAVSDVLEKEGHTVLFITDERGRNYTKYFSKSRIINLRYRAGFLGRVQLWGSLFLETIRMVFFLHKLKPHKVMGFGGYPSIPAVLAAQILRIPTMLHEQNMNIGKANRWLSIGAKKLIGSFSKTPSSLFLGNPVREEFLHVKPYTISSKRFNILVLGGSLGAKILSEQIPIALSKLPKEKQKIIHVRHQCIDRYREATEQAYQNFEGEYELSPFFEEPAKEMERATLIITRAGGGSVAEICATGRPSILIPFAASKEDDQYHNALFMKNQGASFLFSEYHFNADNLYKILYYLMDHPDQLIEMAKHAHNLSKPNAALDIANLITKG